MAWQPDPLLLEMFEGLHKDLSRALEARQRSSEGRPDGHIEVAAERTDRIVRLKALIAGLEAALERREPRLVH